MISTGAVENVAAEMAQVYADAERIALEKVVAAVKKGLKDPADWRVRKYVELRRLRESMMADVIGPLNDEVPAKVRKMVLDAYRKGRQGVIPELEAAGIDPGATASFGLTDVRKMEALASALKDRLLGSHLRIVRQTEDIYRLCVAQSAENVLAGIDTRREASARILRDFADRGVTGFVDKSGRRWNLTSYTEMATRSTVSQAAITGTLDRMAENGLDLVQISDHSPTCPLCAPWNGRALSVSGTNPAYASLVSAEAAGLFHPNCTHTLGAYIPGVSRITPRSEYDPAEYDATQEQRRLERMVRRWKNREVAAFGDADTLHAKRKIREYQARLREHTAEWDLRRKYIREQIKRAI